MTEASPSLPHSGRRSRQRWASRTTRQKSAWTARSDLNRAPTCADTENVPLKEDIDAYFQREVLPHVPDAWIDA